MRTQLVTRPGAAVLPALATVALALATLVGAVPGSPPARAAVAPEALAPAASVALAGSGFGHGVGLAQYGAYGMALQGASVQQIMAHYYTGTTLAPVDDSKTLRVNLLHAVSTARLAPLPVTAGQAQPAGLVVVVGSTRTVVQPGDVVTATVTTSTTTTAGSTKVVSLSRLPKGQTTPVALGSAASVGVEWNGVPELAGNTALLDLAGPGEQLGDGPGRYRYGSLRLAVGSSGAIEAVLSLRLHDEYLRGVAEMPSSWSPAALQAQVVASRGYALTAGYNAACLCDVWDTTSSQVYSGWSKETEPTYGARWVQAVTATDSSATTGLAVLSGGAPARTFFFSSSGGRTENSEDSFATALPYLRSVDDPYSLLPSVHNSLAAWTRTVSGATVAAAFGLPDLARLDLSARTTGGSVATAVATSTGGQQAQLRGQTFAGRLGLPAAWVRRTSTRYAGTDRYATAVAVSQAVAPAARTVVIVNGDDGHLVDGLVAGPLAYRSGAPVLLVSSTGVPTETADELRRRGATAALVVGGVGAVPDAVAGQLQRLGLSVTRYGGTDRYGTAAAVARAVGASGGAAVVASGADASLADALSASGPAARTGRPILLVAKSAVPAETAAALTDLKVTSTSVLGSALVIDDTVLAQLPAPVRLAGADRYGTSAAVVAAFRGLVPGDQLVLVSGASAHLVDALAAGPFGRLTVLAPVSGALPQGTADALQTTLTASGLVVLGGTPAVGADVVTLAQDA